MGLFIFDKNGVVEVTGSKSAIELDLQIQNRDLPESERCVLWEGEIPDRMFYSEGTLKEKYFEDLARLGYKTLEEVKEYAINKIDTRTRDSLIGGFQSSALGAPHTYDSDEIDQMNLIGAVATGLSVDYKCIDEAGVKAFRTHTASQIKNVLKDGSAIKINALKIAREAKDRIESATTIEQVLAEI